MALDTASLEPIIYRILTAPGTDLSTISAKRVRRQLAEQGTLTVESIKEHREEIDLLITKVFERVSAEQDQKGAGDENDADDDSAEEESVTSRKRQHEDEDEDDEERDSPAPKKAKKASSNGKKLSDEALARKLSNEINGRATRTGKTGGKARATKPRAKKSAATVDSDDDSENDGVSKKKASKKRASNGQAKGGFQKEFILSEPLSLVVQAEKMSRPQVVKQLWVYIKDNELQNPSNKREIMCDSNLKAVFGKEKIDMFAMNKVLGQHLHEPES